MQIWLFSLLSFTAPSKRSHSPFHLLLRAWSYPSPPSTCCSPFRLGMCAYWCEFFSLLLFLLVLLFYFRSPLLLPLVPLTAGDLSSPASLLGWLEVSCSKVFVQTEQIWWCIWLFCISPTGLVLFRLKNVQFQVLSVLSCVGFPPDSPQNECAHVQDMGGL